MVDLIKHHRRRKRGKEALRRRATRKGGGGQKREVSEGTNISSPLPSKQVGLCSSHICVFLPNLILTHSHNYTEKLVDNLQKQYQKLMILLVFSFYSSPRYVMFLKSLEQKHPHIRPGPVFRSRLLCDKLMTLDDCPSPPNLLV